MSQLHNINICYNNLGYGNIFSIISNKLDIIGIDIDITITFVPISIFRAIAVYPESLQILNANSERSAIPVIFSRISIN